MGPVLDDDMLIAAPAELAAEVLEIGRARLRGWARSELLVPNGSAGYGFDDLVVGRVLVLLEQRGISRTQIRRIVSMVRLLLGPEGPSQVEWATVGDEAFVQLPGGDWFGGRAPGQIVIHQVLNLDEIRADTRRRLGRPASCFGKIERRRGVHSSRPVFAGTRVPVDTVRRYLEAGMPDARVLKSFPSLTAEDLELVRPLAG